MSDEENVNPNEGEGSTPPGNTPPDATPPADDDTKGIDDEAKLSDTPVNEDAAEVLLQKSKDLTVPVMQNICKKVADMTRKDHSLTIPKAILTILKRDFKQIDLSVQKDCDEIVNHLQNYYLGSR